MEDQTLCISCTSAERKRTADYIDGRIQLEGIDELKNTVVNNNTDLSNRINAIETDISLLQSIQAGKCSIGCQDKEVEALKLSIKGQNKQMEVLNETILMQQNVIEEMRSLLKEVAQPSSERMKAYEVWMAKANKIIGGSCAHKQ